jgi:hypothetical protein
MGKPTPKKLEKKQSRQKKEARLRQRASEAIRVKERYEREFPQFIFERHDAPPGFVSLIREAIAGLRFDDPRVFDKASTDVFRAIRFHGSHEIVSRLALRDHVALLHVLGQTIFDRIPAEKLLSYLPWNDAQFVLAGPDIRVLLRTLLTKPGEGGTVYYSKHKPTVSIDGREYVVAFSMHAIERTCERFAPEWQTYLGLGDAFAIFHQCKEFEFCHLSDDSLALIAYASSQPEWWHWKVMEAIVGHTLDPKANWGFRIGYFPIVIEGGFAKAKTMIPPGFDKTIECKILRDTAMPEPDRRRLLEAARNMSRETIMNGGGLQALRWFHNNGVRQVMQRKVDFGSPLK